MSFPSGYREIPLTSADRERAVVADMWAFPSSSDTDVYLSLPWALPDGRFWGVVADEPVPDLPGFPPASADARPEEPTAPSEPIVATHASYALPALAVPGGTVPAAGLTWVGVHPEHRRRGIMRAMLTGHLQRTAARGEIVSVLTAAEEPIYGRFGYARAAEGMNMTLRRGAQLRSVPGAEALHVHIEEAEQARHGAMVAALHEQAGLEATGTGLTRPGWVTRATPALQDNFWADPSAFRSGAESRRIAWVTDSVRVLGYAFFRRVDRWEKGVPGGTVRVGEAVALTPAAAHALWSVLLDLDLMKEVRTPPLPVDDPLVTLLVNRRAGEPHVTDTLWVRVVDVPRALAARQYAAPIDLHIEVTDALLPANADVWHVAADAFAPATAMRADGARPDLTLDVRDLGAIYLGGTSASALQAAGLITEHTAGAVAHLAGATRWPIAPACSWVF